jgi:hypothetical protein
VKQNIWIINNGTVIIAHLLAKQYNQTHALTLLAFSYKIHQEDLKFRIYTIIAVIAMVAVSMMKGEITQGQA